MGIHRAQTIAFVYSLPSSPTTPRSLTLTRVGGGPSLFNRGYHAMVVVANQTNVDYFVDGRLFASAAFPASESLATCATAESGVVTIGAAC